MKSPSLATIIVLSVTGCAGTAVTRESMRPIPEHPPRAIGLPGMRGTEQAASRLSPEQQVAIIGEVVRRFYRPMMAQARWIDPQPLAHQRARSADSLARPNEDRAIAIVEAVGIRRVCPLTEANSQCRGLRGGVLRFSPAYVVGSTGTDSAIVYARYTPVDFGVAGEIEFFMVHRDGRWQIASRRSMPDVGDAAVVTASGVVDPKQAMDDLLATDRQFAQLASDRNLVTALSNMFVTNVVLNARGGLARGKDSVLAVINADSLTARSPATWTPVGGGVSSDGQDGYTYGYMTVRRTDGTQQHTKYLAYWVNRPGGWRVAVYRRTLRPEGQPSLAMLPVSLPVAGLPRGDATTVQRYADELSAAEKAFSNDAQPMGLGPAFFKWGAPDAVNMGHEVVEFVRGPEAISKAVGSAPPGGSVTWGPNEVIVSSTGDLGVTIGTIRILTPAQDKSSAMSVRDVPFFTIWRRRTPADPWRYVAE
jgi:hypothetical protein